MKRLLSSFIVLIGAIIAQADLTQNANLSLTAGGTNTLPGTGIDFTNYVWTGDGSLLNMGGYYISNTVDTSGFTLNLNTAAINNGGVLSTCRGASQSGPLILTNLTSAVLSNVTTFCTSAIDGPGTGGVTIKGTDAGNAGNTLTLNCIDTGTGPAATSGSVDLQGFYGITVSGQNAPRRTVYAGSGGIYTLATDQQHASTAGSVMIGTAGTPIGAGGVTIPYGIVTVAIESTYQNDKAGSISVYTLGPVSIGGLNALSGNKSTPAPNNVIVVNGGDASLGRIDSRGYFADYNNTAGSVTITGGGNTTGLLSIISIDSSAGPAGSSDSGISGPVTIGNYR
jgi:hypothetical protein